MFTGNILVIMHNQALGPIFFFLNNALKLQNDVGLVIEACLLLSKLRNLSDLVLI